MTTTATSRNPLTGLSGLQQILKRIPVVRRYPSRNPLTGLSGLQQFLSAEEAFLPWRSQSPYGAKWFATFRKCYSGGSVKPWSQSPYGAKWFATPITEEAFTRVLKAASQSPYGAKWFATLPP